MNKQKLLGSALLGFMMAFTVVMPASASSADKSTERAAIKACKIQVKTDRKVALETAKADLKAAEKTAILAWKQAVDAAKNLEGDDRSAALKEARNVMQAAVKQARKDHKAAEKAARGEYNADKKSCKPVKANENN